MAACRLAAKGRTLADSSYDNEVKTIQAFLSMQHPAQTPAINPAGLGLDITPEDYVAPRFIRKLKGKVYLKSDKLLEQNLIEGIVFSAGAAHFGGARQRQGPESGRGQNALHQSLAVTARVRNFPVHRQIHGPQEGGAARRGFQQAHAHGDGIGRSS